MWNYKSLLDGWDLWNKPGSAKEAKASVALIDNCAFQNPAEYV